MNKEEYQQLVKASVSFQEMTEIMQAKILAAEGLEKDNYIKIFQDEKQMLTQAWQQMQNSNQAVINGFVTEVKSAEIQKRLLEEQKTKEAEEASLTGLLNEI